MNEQTAATQTVKGDLTWLQKHERLIVAVLLILALLFAGNKYLNISAQNADNKAAISAQLLTDQKAENAKLAEQVQQTAQQYQQLVQTLSQQNAQLAQAVASRNTVLVQQQQTDKTLPLPDLATRWEKLADLSPGDLTPGPSGISVSDSGARQTVAQLESVPVLTVNLKDETTVADNRQTELNQANIVISGLNTQADGLRTQIKDEETNCNNQLLKAKDDARKSKLHWFLGGVVSGAAVLAHFLL